MNEFYLGMAAGAVIVLAGCLSWVRAAYMELRMMRKLMTRTQEHEKELMDHNVLLRQKLQAIQNMCVVRREM